MKRFLLSILVLFVVSPGFAGAEATRTHDNAATPIAQTALRDDTVCDAYGCEARVISLMCGQHAIMGSTTLPVTWSGTDKPPAAFARITVIRDDGFALDPRQVQLIPIHWTPVDYVCCCPAEWYGEFADVLTLEVEPGMRLLVEIGERETCATTVTVSFPFAPQLKPMPVGTRLAPADTGQ